MGHVAPVFVPHEAVVAVVSMGGWVIAVAVVSIGGWVLAVAEAVVSAGGAVVVLLATQVNGTSAVPGCAHIPTHAHVRFCKHAPMSPVIVEPHVWPRVLNGLHAGRNPPLPSIMVHWYPAWHLTVAHDGCAVRVADTCVVVTPGA